MLEVGDLNLVGLAGQRRPRLRAFQKLIQYVE